MQRFAKKFHLKNQLKARSTNSAVVNMKAARLFNGARVLEGLQKVSEIRCVALFIQLIFREFDRRLALSDPVWGATNSIRELFDVDRVTLYLDDLDGKNGGPSCPLR
jgi:hypothetical protein